MEPEELADAIKRLTDWAALHAPEPKPEPRLRLREHFDAEPLELAIVSRPLQAWDRPNSSSRSTPSSRARHRSCSVLGEGAGAGEQQR